VSAVQRAAADNALVTGSAAYNLLVISAVCIMAVPDGETKIITDFAVFAFTAVVSIWAYLWMLVVYTMWTPDQITILEAFLTLAFLPIMVFIAYKIDTRAGGPDGLGPGITDSQPHDEGYGSLWKLVLHDCLAQSWCNHTEGAMNLLHWIASGTSGLWEQMWTHRMVIICTLKGQR
jgi:Sodium/calcium exchanger protein